MLPQRSIIDNNERAAPYLDVSKTELVAVEHPFLVRNAFKAVETLGGSTCIANLAENRSTPLLLKPRAGDVYSKTIESCVVPTDNLLLRIQVPKWTGRRRKRSSGQPFQSSTSHVPPRTEDATLRSLRDNESLCEVTVMGRINTTHRFRDPPDFVWATATHPFLSNFKETILSGSYTKIAEFQIDKSNAPAPLVPPPTITPSVTPYSYSYRQHVSVRTVEIDGKKHTFNAAHHEQRRLDQVRYDVKNIPDPPRKVLEASLARLPALDQELVAKLQHHFGARPVWTRRGIRNQLKAEGRTQAFIENPIYAHVAYTFANGPWRDALVRFGVDPRKDPEMRIYQTMSYRIDVMGPSRKTAGSTNPRLIPASRGGQVQLHPDCPKPAPEYNHIFDGKSIDTSGKLLQACDITDPLVKTLLSTADVRERCDLSGSGWYLNGTWGKARAITKAKIRHLVQTGQPLDVTKNKQVHSILEIPDQITYANWQEAKANRAAGVATFLPTANAFKADIRPSLPPELERHGIVESGVAHHDSDSLARDLLQDQEDGVGDEETDGMTAVMQELREHSGAPGSQDLDDLSDESIQQQG